MCGGSGVAKSQEQPLKIAVLFTSSYTCTSSHDACSHSVSGRPRAAATQKAVLTHFAPTAAGPQAFWGWARPSRAGFTAALTACMIACACTGPSTRTAVDYDDLGVPEDHPRASGSGLASDADGAGGARASALSLLSSIFGHPGPQGGASTPQVLPCCCCTWTLDAQAIVSSLLGQAAGVSEATAA